MSFCSDLVLDLLSRTQERKANVLSSSCLVSLLDIYRSRVMKERNNARGNPGTCYVFVCLYVCENVCLD